MQTSATPTQTSRTAVLTIEEAAQVLRIGRSAAYEAARRGEIPTIRVGRLLRVPRHRLEQLLGPVNESDPADKPGLTKTAEATSHEERYSQ